MRREFPQRVPVLAWSLAGFTVLELAAALVLTGLNAGRMAGAGSPFTASAGSLSSCTRAPAAW